MKSIARDIAKSHYIHNFVASNGWVKRLKERHPELGTRVAKGFERTRVGALNPQQTQKYMELVRDAMAKVEELNGGVQFTPELLLNLDETGFDPVNNQDVEVVCIKTRKSASHTITSSDRTHSSAAVCISASGFRFKTMYAMKGTKRMYNKLPCCPDGTTYVMTEKGYFGDAAFEKYIKFLVSQIPKDGRWRLLIMDGYGSHTMVPSVLDYLFENKIHAICMPSHSSEFLQPLDVSCFAPTKGEFRVVLRDILFQFGTDCVSRWHLPAVFEKALEAGCKEQNIRAGFEACGLWPFDINWMSKNPDKFKLSEDLDALQERTLSSKFDPDSCSHVTIATKLQTLHDSIETNLKLPDISASTRKSLEDLQKDLGEIYLPMSHRLVNIFKEPAIAKTNVTRTRKDNAIGESNAAAKWLTEDNRRASVRALGAAMEADKN